MYVCVPLLHEDTEAKRVRPVRGNPSAISGEEEAEEMEMASGPAGRQQATECIEQTGADGMV
jgi:hypothetical protein